ncbi:MAG: hypothetical protein K1X29_01435 [Bdellovibrionales bacterium]|nr:hypothetical protein [Bdellovibrionales bacterium]
MKVIFRSFSFISSVFVFTIFMTLVFFLSSLFLTPSNLAWAQNSIKNNSQLEEIFHQGTQLYNENKTEEANIKFKEILGQQPHNIPALFNWGLTEYKLNRKGLAVGAWRKILNLSPGYSPAVQALSFAYTSLHLTPPMDTLEEWSSFIGLKGLKTNLSSALMLFFSLGSLCIGGVIWLRYFRKRIHALREDQIQPKLPWLGFAAILLFIFTGLIGATKEYDRFIPKATLLQNTPVRTGPSEISSTVVEMIEGSEVLVRQVNKEWVQIQQPGGASGWVPGLNLYRTDSI